MFRGKTQSKPDPSLFGVGSFVIEGNAVAFMVIAVSGNGVRLLDMRTFLEQSPIVSVEDPNFLSEDECRKLISGTGCTFSDFDFQSRGLKGHKLSI
jgi:hypothetical protein